MEVHHKPKPIHGWREFATEIGVIVIGVLIALGGEQIVEVFHRGEQARQAERAMRLELAEDDGPQAYARVLINRCLEDRIGQIHDGAASAPADKLRDWVADYAPPVRTWDSEAWKAVLSSSVANNMGAEKLVDWSAAYRIPERLNQRNDREADLVAELREALPTAGEPSAANRETLRRLAGLLRASNTNIVRGSELFLLRIRALGAPVPAATQQTLVKQARALYGDCVIVPRPDAPAPAGDLVRNLRGLGR